MSEYEKVDCPRCGGDGWIWGFKNYGDPELSSKTCPNCGGSGKKLVKKKKKK